MRQDKATDLKDEGALLTEYRRTGDIRLIGELYAFYMPLVYGVCLKYFQDSAKSEDAVMAIFEELVVKLRVHQVANFRSWLYSLARNFCLMEIRRDKKVELVDIDVLQHELSENTKSVGQTFDLELEGNLQMLEACLDTLTVEQQRCIRLFFLEKRCYADIAKDTGFTLSKVKSYIQNGKRNLKLCMEKMGYGK